MVRDVFTMLELLRYIGFKVNINYKKKFPVNFKIEFKIISTLAPYTNC